MAELADVLKELSYQAASSMAEQKENAIRNALNHYFQREWTPEEVGEESAMHVYSTGVEQLYLGGELYITFGPIMSDTKINDDGAVECQYFQAVEEHYK